MPGFRSWLPSISCVTLGKLLNLSVPQSLICKIDVTLAPIPLQLVREVPSPPASSTIKYWPQCGPWHQPPR